MDFLSRPTPGTSMFLGTHANIAYRFYCCFYSAKILLKVLL
jgi:hypothetical protein